MLYMLDVVGKVSEEGFMLWGYRCLGSGSVRWPNQKAGPTNSAKNPLAEIRPLGESLVEYIH